MKPHPCRASWAGGWCFLQGRVLGGSSSINGMIYTRGHAREYNIWRQMGCTG